MKVLHVTPAYYPATYWGGPIFSVYALNNALALLPDVYLTVLTTDSAGPDVTTCLDRSKLSGLYPNQEVIITRRIAGACVSIELLKKLPGLVSRADVVHLTATYSFPTIPTLFFCRIFNKPLVWSPRGAIQDAYEWEGSRRRNLKRVWELICDTLVRQGKVITHTTSERERVATQQRLPRATALIVPNGVYVPEVLPVRDWLPDGRFRMMYIGRLSQKKGIENLLNAMALIDDPTVSLTIYGSGDVAYTASLQELAGNLGLLGNSVVFAGNVDGENKSSAFHSADVCVVPSYTENFCLVVSEALAHGVPVIASKGTPWADVEKYRCGLWVENSVTSLGNAIKRIRYQNPAVMGLRGHRWMQSEFGWDRVASSINQIYRAAVKL